MPTKYAKYATLHVYATPETKLQIRKLANAHKRSVSSEIQILIEFAYRKEFEHENSRNIQRPPLV